MFICHCINTNPSFKLNIEKEGLKYAKSNLYGAQCSRCMNSVVSVDNVTLIKMNLSMSLSKGVLF